MTDNERTKRERQSNKLNRLFCHASIASIFIFFSFNYVYLHLLDMKKAFDREKDTCMNTFSMSEDRHL